MPKARTRKTPITNANTKSTPSSSSTAHPQASRTLIRQFHTLLKQQAQLQSVRSTPDITSKLIAIQNEIVELGGLEEYQRMSSIGQGQDRGGGSEKVLIEWTKKLGMSAKEKGKQRLLEVGALLPDNYAKCPWVECTPMDLRSRHPKILEQDFLEMDHLDVHREKWDIISLSLVVNFVPDPRDRGRMLSMAHAMLVPDGLLFLALPLPCLDNSRYLTFEHLKALMSMVGFTEIEARHKKGGKMAYFLYKHEEADPTVRGEFGKKEVFKTGHRNNFCILL